MSLSTLGHEAMKRGIFFYLFFEEKGNIWDVWPAPDGDPFQSKSWPWFILPKKKKNWSMFYLFLNKKGVEI
jgi:hypothetical protein